MTTYIMKSSKKLGGRLHGWASFSIKLDKLRFAYRPLRRLPPASFSYEHRPGFSSNPEPDSVNLCFGLFSDADKKRGE